MMLLNNTPKKLKSQQFLSLCTVKNLSQQKYLLHKFLFHNSGGLVAGFSLQRPQFNSMAVHGKLVVSKVALEQVPLQVLWGSCQHCSTSASHSCFILL